MNAPFKNVLFYCNLAIDLGKPEFRVGSYLHYLIPLAKALSSVAKVDIKIIMNDSVHEVMKASGDRRMAPSEWVVAISHSDMVRTFGIGDQFQRGMQTDSLTPDQVSAYHRLLGAKLGDWQPDVIISWESPTTLLRQAYPDALALDLMPGMFMRPPYPKTVCVDVKGIYNHSVVFEDGFFDSVEDREIELLNKLRNRYTEYYKYLGQPTFGYYNSKNPESFRKTILMPLQISGHFSFKSSCKFSDQFEFLCSVLSTIPKDVGVFATQYASGMVSECAINQETLPYLARSFPNLIYSAGFDKIDNISQYLLPFVDATVSVSSTIGLQSVFLGIPLLSPSTSHLTAYAAEQDVKRLENLFEGSHESHVNDARVAASLARQHLLWNEFLLVPEKLLSYLSLLYQARHATDPADRMPVYADTDWIEAEFVGGQTYERASRIISPYGGRFVLSSNKLAQARKQMKSTSVVSFDIFDTLLSRPVYHPADVFMLVRRRLQNDPGYQSIDYIVKNFVQIRQSAEMSIRRSIDAACKENPAHKPEEMTLDQIYQEISKVFPAFEPYAKDIQALEQEFEYEVLMPRTTGRAIYISALNQDKRIIAVSDTSLSQKFLRKVLNKNGYSRIDEIYASSTIGLKKHSGRLFHQVLKAEKISAKDVLHIGDNEIGDVEMPTAAGINVLHIPSAREQVVRLVKERRIDMAPILGSFALRTTLALYGNRFKDLQRDEIVVDGVTQPAITQLIENERQFGYLVLGPIVQEFAIHCIETAEKLGLTHLCFLARDTWVIKEAVDTLIKATNKNIQTRYVYASRKGLLKASIATPEDVLKFYVSDFNQNNTIAQLVEDRLSIPRERVSNSLLKNLGIPNLDVRIKTIPFICVLQLLQTLLIENWETLSTEYGELREHYRKYLDSLDILDCETAALVDWGYKGTIHRMVEGISGSKYASIMYAGYAEDYGIQPHDTHIYASSTLSPHAKSEDFIVKYGLLLETILNKPEGSLVQIGASQPSEEDNEVGVSILLDSPPPPDHVAKVNGIHQGVLKMVTDFISSFGEISALPRFESNSSSYFASHVLGNPTLAEASCLAGLLFDNAFAGHPPRYVLEDPRTTADGKTARQIIQDSLWKEGASAIVLGNDPYVVRRRLVAEGAPEQSGEYEESQNFPSLPGVTLLYGFAKVETLNLDGESYAAAWAAEPVSAIDIRNSRTFNAFNSVQCSILFRKSVMLKNHEFKIYQGDQELNYSTRNISSHLAEIILTVNPRIPLVFKEPNFRTPSNKRDSRARLHWCFIDISLLSFE
jgi:HAD superfamily hydrolase (TIGR01549 family)